MNTPMPFLPPEASSMQWVYHSPKPNVPITAMDIGPSLQSVPTFDVQVDVIELREITFTSGIKKGDDGIRLQIVIRTLDEDALWAFFEESREEFAEAVNKAFQEFCGEQFEIAEIHYQQGSIILTFFVGVNAWALAHQGILSAIGFVFGLYQPLKSLISDSQKWIPKLKNFIVGFFSRRSRTPLLIRH